ncbi:MAG: lysophospholipase [Propionibacteriaceae bacterium]|jgi:alpha-beta hydrolase superfamily lysophospholipase|nr:lysophospholipase [Propionibacteriaceae bacterium]
MHILLYAVEIIAVIFVVFSIVSWLMCKSGFDKAFGRCDTDLSHTITSRFADYPELGREAVSFDCRGNQLRGFLFGPEDGPALVVIMTRMGNPLEQMLPVIDWLAGRGYQVLSFDGTGCYSSDGDGTCSAAQSAIDLDAALTWARRQPQFARLPVLLYGHSSGGYATASILKRRSDIAGAVAIGAYNNPTQLTNDTQRAKMGAFALVEYPYFWLETWRRAGKFNTTAVAGVNAGSTPVLVVQGANDTIVTAKTSLFAQRGQVRNPRAQFVWRDEPGQDDHVNLVCSERAVAYQREIPALLERQRGASFSRREKDAFWAKINRRRANELDPSFQARVEDFFAAALARA